MTSSTITRTCLIVSLLVSGARVAIAQTDPHEPRVRRWQKDPEQALVKVFMKTLDAPNKAKAFFEGLAELDGIRMGPEQLKRVWDRLEGRTFNLNADQFDLIKPAGN